MCDGIPKNCVLTPGKEGVAHELDRLDGLASERRASKSSFLLSCSSTFAATRRGSPDLTNEPDLVGSS